MQEFIDPGAPTFLGGQRAFNREIDLFCKNTWLARSSGHL
jgi:hypothetical protein